MTIVGKILVFFNLLFSIATAALIVIVFSTRANWKAEYEKARNLALVAEAAYKTEKVQHDNDLKSKDETIATLTREREQLTKDVATARTEADRAQARLADSQGANTRETSTHRLLETEVKRLKQERDQMVTEKTQREALIVKLTNDVNDAKKSSVQNEVAYKTSLTRNEKLLTAYEQVVKENQALKFQLGGPANGSAPNQSILTSTAPPPPKDVRGVVTATNKNGLAQISVGSDNGVSVGNELDVFRVNPENPLASQYLGKLRVTRVEPKAAVGQFVAAGREKLPKEGDEVAASITGR